MTAPPASPAPHSPAAAIAAIRLRAVAAQLTAARRWERVVPADGGPIDTWAARFAVAGRLTVNFHPDRVTRGGRTVTESLLAEGRYRSQWATGISSGSRSAVAGGARHRFEQALFGGAYDDVDPSTAELPVYGAFDLLADPHGGSPRFGSAYLVLHDHLRTRTTLSATDSHTDPADVATFDQPWPILAALAEQAESHRLLDRPLGIESLFAALLGALPAGPPARSLDGYVEAQIHGGVALDGDVASIVADPSHRPTVTGACLADISRRYGLKLRWHTGSILHVDDVPSDFRGPTMPELAHHVAAPGGHLDAAAIGSAARRHRLAEPLAEGDPPDSELQQLKYLWHVLLAYGSDASSR